MMGRVEGIEESGGLGYPRRSEGGPGKGGGDVKLHIDCFQI